MSNSSNYTKDVVVFFDGLYKKNMKNRNEIKIVVAGYSATGKSTMIYLLNEFLEKHGWNVEIKLNNEDYKDVDDLKQKIGDTIDARKAALKQNTKVFIEECNLNKQPTYSHEDVTDFYDDCDCWGEK